MIDGLHVIVAMFLGVFVVLLGFGIYGLLNPVPINPNSINGYPVHEFTPSTATTYTCVAYRGGLQCLRKEASQ